MTLLELIIKASTNPEPSIDPIKYPINLDADPIFPNLKPSSENPYPNPNPNPNTVSLVNPLTGFQISESDSNLIDFTSKFFKKLKRKLRDSHSLSSSSFAEMLNAFLEKVGEKKFGGSVNLGSKGDDEGYTCKLMEKFGSFVGRDVMGLVIEGCIVLDNWDLLKTLIVSKLVDHGLCSDLLFNLVAKRRSDLICLCVRHFTDLKSSDLCGILKYFLSPVKDASFTMVSVRKEWESEAVVAIDRASDRKLSGKKSGLAKEAAILLMIAYDGFSSNELCLHFLLSSSNVDDVVFSSAISKLNAEEMSALIRYLGKWLSKYERFPQAGPCSEAVTSLGLKMCQWVPRLEDVTKCLGLVVEEHFSSLALHSEFHEQLKVVEGVVSSLVSEGRMSCLVENLIEILKPEVGGA